MIEYELPRGIVKYSKCLTYPIPFNATQINNPFLNSRISANHDTPLPKIKMHIEMCSVHKICL